MIKTKFKNFHINFFSVDITLIFTKFLGYVPHSPPEGSLSQNVDLGPGYFMEKFWKTIFSLLFKPIFH